MTPRRKGGEPTPGGVKNSGSARELVGRSLDEFVNWKLVHARDSRPRRDALLSEYLNLSLKLAMLEPMRGVARRKPMIGASP